MTRFRQLIDELCFDLSIGLRIGDQLDADKPICITYNGGTAFESSYGGSGTLDQCVVAIRNTFDGDGDGNETNEPQTQQDPAESVHFKEPQIDLVRAFMLTELQQLKQQHELSRSS